MLDPQDRPIGKPLWKAIALVECHSTNELQFDDGGGSFTGNHRYAIHTPKIKTGTMRRERPARRP